MTDTSWASLTTTLALSDSQNIAALPTSVPPRFEPTVSRNAARGSVDWKFRFVFILWPSLFGLIMAL